MTTAEKSLDKETLSRLAPLSILSPELLDELMGHAVITQLPPGKKAFTAGDSDNQAVFLLSGQLALVSDGSPPMLLKAGSTAASQALETRQPRQATALASTAVTIMRIDATFLDALIARNGLAPPNIGTDLSTPEDRLARAMALPLFKSLPPPYVTVISQRITEIVVTTGDVIVHEGDRGKYYYLITRGSAAVTRFSHPSSHTVIAELTSGCGFGEESLIVGGRHNSSVTMTSDGHLLRLSRGEFMTLIMLPLTKMISLPAAVAMQREGTVILDVRTPSAFTRHSLHGSVNLPISVLRRTACILDKSKRYVVTSDLRDRSVIAAFLLAFQGMEVQILDQPVTSATL